MKITRDNYEIFFLDYLEGNLDHELIDDFIDFLIQNPDLKEELQTADAIKLEADILYFEKKESLYKEEYDLPEKFNNVAVAFAEGDISASGKAELDAYLSVHPSKQKELELFEKVKLKADINIVFRKKSRLYRPNQEKRILLWIARVAAVIAIAFLAYRMGSDFTTEPFPAENKAIISENRKEPQHPITLPKDSLKKEYPVSDRILTPVAERKTDIKALSDEKPFESTQKQPDIENNAQSRVSAEIQEKIPSLYATLGTDSEIHNSLMPIEIGVSNPEISINDERLLVDIVKEKTGLDNLSVKKAARMGLNLISGISGKKFNYEMNSGGQITQLNYDSRLLAFSIPMK